MHIYKLVSKLSESPDDESLDLSPSCIYQLFHVHLTAWIAFPYHHPFYTEYTVYDANMDIQENYNKIKKSTM